MPLLALAALATTFTLHLGQTRALPHLRVGDVVVCSGNADTIRRKVSTQDLRESATVVWDKKLGLEFTRQAGGRLTVSCRTH